MIAFPPFVNLEDAWLSVLEAAEAKPDGRLLHAVLAINDPGAPLPEVVAVNDALLAAHGDHTVDTVANTLFPANLYASPNLDYRPGLEPDQIRRLDAAAERLYETYRDMLPNLRGRSHNQFGTFFGQLVSWPGRTSDGFNQLKRQVEQLRFHRNQGHARTNAANFALEGCADIDSTADLAAGLQEIKATDERQIAVPCLSHIEVSVVGDRLTLTAVYRYWHLVREAFGNLVGLTRLLQFLCQQTGYEPGELMILGTVASAEVGTFSHTALKKLITTVRCQLMHDQAGNLVSRTHARVSSRHGRLTC